MGKTKAKIIFWSPKASKPVGGEERKEQGEEEEEEEEEEGEGEKAKPRYVFVLNSWMFWIAKVFWYEFPWRIDAPLV